MNKTLSGRTVLLWVIGFFAVIISVNVYFITISVTSFSGEDEQKPYLQGVEYNSTLQHRAEQAALGWDASMSARRLATGMVRVAVALRRPDESAHDPVTLEGELRHPSNENRDRIFAMTEIGPGLYQADLKDIGTGAWDMIVKSAQRQKPFEASRRLWVP